MKKKFLKKHCIATILSALLFLLLSSCAVSTQGPVPRLDRSIASATQNVCGQTIQKYFLEFKEEVKRFAKGFGPLDADAHIMYGFESEYMEKEAGNLLANYMPLIGEMTPDKWKGLTSGERLEFIKAHESEIFPYRKKGKLKKIAPPGELNDALPDSLVRDGHNFEIVLDPVDSPEEFISKIDIINQKMGVGSMQVTVSSPVKIADPNVFFNEQLGYYNYINDLDTLTKLQNGFLRYRVDPKAKVARSFIHPWLGPMNKGKHATLKKFLNLKAQGKKASDESLESVSLNKRSHKFVGATVYRPDIAYSMNRMANEVRDCHKNVICIKERLIRETLFLERGKERFADTAELLPFDAIEDFIKLQDAVGTPLREFFNRIFPPRTEALANLQIFKNFAYPLRDWSKHIEYFKVGYQDLSHSVPHAQDIYVQKVLSIKASLESGKISEDEAGTQIMAALAEFSDTSGLFKAFQQTYDKFLAE